MSTLKKAKDTPCPRMLLLEEWHVRLCENDCVAASILSFLLQEFRDMDAGSLLPFTIAQIKAGIFGMASDKTIRNAIEKLKALEIISVAQNPNTRYRFDRRHFYTVNIEKCSKFKQEYCYSLQSRNLETPSGKFTKSNIYINNNTVNSTLSKGIVNFNNCINKLKINKTGISKSNYSCCVDDVIGAQLTQRQENYLRAMLKNTVVQHKTVITMPEEMYRQAVFAILNEQQFKGVTSFTKRVNIIAKLCRNGQWRVPIGYYNHSDAGKQRKNVIQIAEQAERDKATMLRARTDELHKTLTNICSHAKKPVNINCTPHDQIKLESVKLKQMQNTADKLRDIDNKIQRYTERLQSITDPVQRAVLAELTNKHVAERKLMHYDLKKSA